MLPYKIQSLAWFTQKDDHHYWWMAKKRRDELSLINLKIFYAQKYTTTPQEDTVVSQTA